MIEASIRFKFFDKSTFFNIERNFDVAQTKVQVEEKVF